MNTKEIQNEIKATENRLKVLRESIEAANKPKHGYHNGEPLVAPEGYEITPAGEEVGHKAIYFSPFLSGWSSWVNTYKHVVGTFDSSLTYARPIKAKPGEVWTFDENDATPTLLFRGGFVHLNSNVFIGYTLRDHKEEFNRRKSRCLGTHSEVYVLRSEVEKEYVSKKELSRVLNKSCTRGDSGVGIRRELSNKFDVRY